MDKVEYKKLTKRLRSILTIAQLWYSDDHFLCMEETFVTQSYRRLYFKDLEGIVIGHSILQYLYVFVWIAIGVLAAAIIVSSAALNEPASLLISLTVMIIIAVFLIRELVGGGICYLLIQTKNGPYKIPARMRLKNAKKIINLIVPLVSELQNQHPQINKPEYEMETPEL